MANEDDVGQPASGAEMSHSSSKGSPPPPSEGMPCDLPYGLTWADLGPILPTTSDDSPGFYATTSFDKDGLHGGDRSCIVTIRRLDEDPFERTVFIKRVEDAGAWEASRYELLASAGVPVPRLLATVSRTDAEVIVLEFLPRIGIDRHSPAEVNALLELVARLNAANVASSEMEARPGMPSDRFDESVRTTLLELEGDPRMRLGADVVFDAYRRAQAELWSMPLAPTHGEFYFQQVGWARREGLEELVMFDLATLALRPRFVDVAGVLPLLVEETGRPEGELLAIYLRALARSGGAVDPHADHSRELRVTRIATSCWALPWLARPTTDTPGFDLEAELALKLRWLCRDVEKLDLMTGS